MIDKIKKDIKEYGINSLITLIFISFISMGINVFLITDFAKDQSLLSTKIYQKYIDFKSNSQNSYNSYYLITKNDIFIRDHDIYFKLNKTFEYVDKDTISQEWFKLKLKHNIYIEYPFFITYSFDNIDIKLKITLANSVALHLFFILSVCGILINKLYFLSLDKKTSKMDNLTTTAQQFALSQRTTSYLVSIIHHKLNTPIKTLTTKSRMLIKTINDEEKNIQESKLTKARSDYEKIDNALETILNITKKLKVYNELSQNESNLYKLFKISKETMDIFKDDTFAIDVHTDIRAFDIDKTIIGSHEIIQIFINQIKYSLSRLADKISINLFKELQNYIVVLYSDNGNKIEKNVINLCSKSISLYDLSTEDVESDVYDLLLNFIILNNNECTKISLFESTKNGTIFCIKLPIIKQNIDNNNVL